MTTNRIYSLDLLRAMAIIFVLIFHWEFTTDTPMFTWINTFQRVGDSGVDLFFILSGYLISNQWFKSIDASSIKDEYHNFYIKRFFRILPLYYLVLAFEALRAYFLTKTPFNLFYYLTFTQNLFGKTIFPVSWSLCVEEHFYIVFPFISYYLLKKGYHKIFISFLLLLIFVPIVSRFVIFFPHFEKSLVGIFTVYDWKNGIEHIPKSSFFRTEAITCGVLLAYIKTYHPIKWKSILSNNSMNLIGSVIFIIIGFFLGSKSLTVSKLVISHLPLAIGYSFLFILLLNNEKKLIRVRSNFIELVAKVSYSLYLTHYISWMILGIIFKKLNIEIPSYINFFIFSGFSILTAWVSYKIIEEPMLHLREKYLKKGKL